jgi:hypothetical protein
MAQESSLLIYSKEKVAEELANRIVRENSSNYSQDFKEKYLDLYTDCLIAVNGNRKKKSITDGL